MHVAMSGVIAGVGWANTFWVRNGKNAIPDASTFAQFIQNTVAKYESHLMAQVSANYRLTHVSGLYYGPTGADLGYDEPRDHTGGLAGQALSAQVSCGISWHVIPHYRGGHPRTYLPGPDTTKLADPRLFTTGHVAAVASAANAFLNDVNSFDAGNIGQLHLGTVSFVLRKEWRSPPVFRDYSPGLAAVDARVDTMRRRLGRDL